MQFSSGAEFQAWADKRLAFIGMSGVGKSTLAGYLDPQVWTTFCTDYQLADRALRPELEAFAGADFVCGPDDIRVLSAYVGKLGAQAKGGLPLDEFLRRQRLHAAAERQTFADLTGQLAAHTGPAIIDAGGSLVEILTFATPDPLLDQLLDQMFFVYIDASEAKEEEVIARQLKAPKPMFYEPAFLRAAIEDFAAAGGQPLDQANPDDFIAFVFPRLMAHRRPRYAALADRGGVRLPFDLANQVRSDQDLLDLIIQQIDGDCDHAH